MEDYSSSFLVYTCVITVLGIVAFLRLFMSELQLTHRLIIYAILLLFLERICCMYLAGLSGVLVFTAVCLLAFQSLSSPKLSVQGKAVLITGLWGLVNNAGMCFNISDAELSAMSNYRGCMEVNFFGAIAITKGFLPLIRRAKGRIVNVSSPVGEIPLPFLAAYGASKAALTLFTNILRLELRHWGVKVCTILPAFYKTAPSRNFEYWEQQVHHLIKNISSELLQDYGEEYMLETKDLFLKYITTAKEDFSPVIESITDAILSRNPKPRYYAGKAVIVLYIFLCILPTSLSDLIFNRFFLIKKVLPKGLQK
ncbi:corticosteroid 11-beta-dehydrogenase isozyme 2-like [Chiloscyllium plagiosum]|uniref:corticosteroid 11-beta-dehydrogenase isozyme 2-like n=1 Tax=Chiloscyllium plagiosum TaxID=36176 RepID=UPI001CB87D5A|nr:corticosteroid 11-beta-dehydrogenase isozyme 2-like [Chiloscyllium plagiosum]